MTRNFRSFLSWVVMVSVAGCVDEAPADPDPFDSGWNNSGDAGLLTNQADGGASSQLCATLDPGVCALQPACAPILGLAYDVTRFCRGESQLPVGCQARDVECGFGTIRVVDPVGQRWVLPNRCIPPGYTPAPTETHPITWIEGYTVCPSAALQTRCGQLDERGCAANETCFAQMGTQLNERRSCKQGTQRLVACVQNAACNRVPTFARDTSGATWELTGSCLPSGFTALPASTVSAHTNWPSCF